MNYRHSCHPEEAAGRRRTSWCLERGRLPAPRHEILRYAQDDAILTSFEFINQVDGAHPPSHRPERGVTMLAMTVNLSPASRSDYVQEEDEIALPCSSNTRARSFMGIAVTKS
jgi:hypothetical protein